MNLKTQMQGIAAVFDQKKYVYVVPADKPADISPLSIGDGKGILHAMVAPVGLPIITGRHHPSSRCSTDGSARPPATSASGKRPCGRSDIGLLPDE